MTGGMKADEFIELLTTWTIHHEKGAGLLQVLTTGGTLDDVPLNERGHALEQARDVLSMLIHAFFEVSPAETGIELHGTRMTAQTFETLLELQVRIENLLEYVDGTAGT